MWRNLSLGALVALVLALKGRVDIVELESGVRRHDKFLAEIHGILLTFSNLHRRQDIDGRDGESQHGQNEQHQSRSA